MSVAVLVVVEGVVVAAVVVAGACQVSITCDGYIEAPHRFEEQKSDGGEVGIRAAPLLRCRSCPNLQLYPPSFLWSLLEPQL